MYGRSYIPEPTGRTAPKVTGDGLNRNIGQNDESLALLCDVQAFPAPLTRYGLFSLTAGRRHFTHSFITLSCHYHPLYLYALLLQSVAAATPPTCDMKAWWIAAGRPPLLWFPAKVTIERRKHLLVSVRVFLLSFKRYNLYFVLFLCQGCTFILFWSRIT